MSLALPRDGVAVGWRPELATDLLRAPEAVDFIEVVAETCFAQPALRREACAAAELWPVVPHGVKLSLGSAEGVDLERARRLGSLARELRAPAISEHVALTRGGGREIGHLTPLPFTREAVEILARNVAAARRVLPDVPLLLENVAWTFRWPEDAIPEGDFYREVVEATGCDLLLDVANLYANALNSGIPPGQALSSYPLDRVAMVHMAGGAETEGFYLDTHAHAVPAAVFELLGRVLEQTGPLPVVLERDADFPPFDELLAETVQLRALLARHPGRQILQADGQTTAFRMTSGPRSRTQDDAGLSARQAQLATLLTAATPPGDGGAEGFDVAALRRTRSVLRHKRVDEVMPLLPRIAAGGEAARALAFAALSGVARAASGAGVADALRVAEAGAGDPRLGPAARLDLLELRSRFVVSDRDGARPRRGPFMGRERLPDGSGVWAVKGVGREARVRFFNRGGGR